MSRLACKFAEAETAVFWDVDSCPIPSGVDLDTIYKNIRSAVENHGYRGNVTIRAFGERDMIRDDFFDAGIMFVPEEDERERADQIMEDVYLWAMDVDHRSKPSNLLIISGDISDDLATHAERISLLKCQNHNVLIAQPEEPSETLLYYVSFVWLWESLSAGGPPHDPSQVDTVVYWDVVDCPVASDIRPRIICENIRSALKNMGYQGHVSFKAYGPLDKIDFTPLATQVSGHLRTSVMFRDVLESSMKSDSKPSNLMIISSNISEDSLYGKAFHFLRSLNHNVLLAQPQIPPSGNLLETVTARWLWETLSSGGAPISSQVVSQSVSSRYDVSQSIATAVFWDVEDCPVPDGLYSRLIRRKITSALKDNGYTTGRVSFTAYGERNKVRDDFTSAGIMFVPAGDKHARVTRMFDDLLTWAKKRREPSNVMIISSDISQDSAFVVAFDLLRSLNHNVILAHPQSSPGELPITVATQWLWETLSAGGPPTLWRIPYGTS